MDGNTYKPISNSGYLQYSADLSNGTSNEIMPSVAPSYKHLWSAERSDYATNLAEQQALSRLRDSAYHIEDVQVVQGAIEVRLRILPKPGMHLENRYYPSYLNPSPSYYKQPVDSYPYQYPNPDCSQYAYQYPYQHPYQYSSPIAAPYQYPYSIQFNPQYQYLYQYPRQLVPHYSYQYSYQYPNQIAPQYLYQYPAANVVRSIAGAISQIEFAAHLFKR